MANRLVEICTFFKISFSFAKWSKIGNNFADRGAPGSLISCGHTDGAD